MEFTFKFFTVTILVAVSIVSNGVEAGNAAALIAMAQEYGAPFAETALKRLHGNVFGTGRATRSSDIVIFNRSSKSFRLESNDCSNGGWSTDMFPVYELQSQESTVLGGESNGFMSGVRCNVRYASSDGSFFHIWFYNPYLGENFNNCDFTPSTLRLMKTEGKGDNNQVRWIIYDP
ncbi:hypothetical protein HA402_009864 [Bradysia odoriphaga]|nr:hypothetical protein HA402_009864 [Bradysia odoriphaga]